ncbi:hypothetical protein T01_1805 [Trichinella spiralis]|uniref:Uncharacterized protein n=1 Tax=Trichinella spiralis TaxID=6334 RepID=A0A0V1BAX4_TRISP|nr:hypothetical protein T01_1805 [Trichinella spiralis]
MQDKFGAISERCIKNPGSNFDVDTIFLCATFAAHRAQQIVVNDSSQFTRHFWSLSLQRVQSLLTNLPTLLAIGS